ncbi:condensation domain-containing protein [Streptomyces naphthomycinicus]|uniref:condensation domain-containing protein n=1 Tax=Streptomyces naphthomycinicus TaxID=2872625 RepID=UPI001CECC844|nr:condensation domain-containing protein [Streptomyces sp. TML10]
MTSNWLSADRRALLERLLDAQGTTAAPARILPRTPGPVVPLSFVQQRIWFLHRLMPDSPRYQIGGGLWLRGPLDVGALRRALEVVLDRHQVLRTTYRVDREGELAGHVGPVVSDMPLIEAGPGAREALDTARRLIGTPLDPTTGPVFRTTLLRVDEDLHLLVVVMHHIVSDGWSLDVLLRELTTAYTDPRLLPALAVQYSDYAAWQRERAASAPEAGADPELAHWRRRLDGAEPLRVPTDRPWPSRPTSAGSTLTETVPAGAAAALLDLARRRRASPFAAAMAVSMAAFARLADQTDVVVAMMVGGRERDELAPLVGCFMNTVPVRVDLSGDPVFSEVLDRVNEAVGIARAHADVPFERLVEALRLGRESGGRTPLVHHLVQWEEPTVPVRLGDLEIEPVPLFTDTAKFDLSACFITTAGGAMTCRAEYSTELFDPGTVGRVLGAMRRVAEVAPEDRPLSALPVERNR